MARRVLTAALAIPLVIGVVSYAPTWVFAGVLAVLLVVGYREFVGLARAQGIEPASVIGGLLTLGLALAHIGPEAGWGNASVWLSSGVLALLLRVLFAGRPLDQALPAAGAALLGAVWVGHLGGQLIAVRSVGGPGAIYSLLLAVWCGDSGAYFTGRALGRRPLAPRISPKKTLEGLGGGLLGSALGFLAGCQLFDGQASGLVALGLGLLLGLAAVAGDLAESALKRGAGVKDSGSLFPGHGGVLDRLDSLLFAAPVMYYCLEHLIRFPTRVP